MGGRGASSSNNKTINGRPIVDNATGYDIWSIGRNAPKGYVPLIKGSGENAKIAYIKSQYADELANNLTVGRVGLNTSANVLNSQINRTKTKIENLKSGKSNVKGNIKVAIERNEKLLKAQELVMKVRRDIYKY